MKRLILACSCDRCRARKTKCTGTFPHSCTSCVDANKPCLYSETEKKVTVAERYLHRLQALARRADFQLRGLEPSALDHDSSLNRVTDEVDLVTFTGTDNWVTGKGGQHYYMGNSSSAYIANRLNPTTETLAWHMYPHCGNLSWLMNRPLVNARLPPLPPYEFAEILYATQHDYIGTIFSFIRDKDFYERLNTVYSRAPDVADRDDCLVYCQVLMVFFLGQVYSVNQWAGYEGPPGIHYFKHAVEFLPDVHGECSILFIEVLCYFGYCLQIINRRDSAYLYLGIALRMAISLGLHHEITDEEIDGTEKERRRRVWWSTYSMERLLCVTSGHPISIQDVDIDVSLPSLISPGDAYLPEGDDDSFMSVSFLRCYTQLSQILGKIGQEIYRRKQKSGIGLVNSAESIMNSLSEWYRHVPSEMKSKASNLDKEVHRETVSIFLYYHQCINLAARPLLLYAVQKQMVANSQQPSSRPTSNWEDGLPPAMVKIIRNAIAAARSSIGILKNASKFNFVGMHVTVPSN